MTKIVWKIFFLLSTLPLMIQIPWKKMLICLKNVNFIKKLPVSNGESLLESIFELNQICKILRTQNRKIWKLNTTDLLYIFLKVWKDALMIYKISKS